MDKLIMQILSGTRDKDIAFSDLCRLLQHFEFRERINGSHHIFSKKDIEEIINIQPIGSKAKPYQVKQIRNIILKHRLGDTDDA